MVEDMLDSWERRKGETKKKYSYFLYYLNMEKPRNLRIVAEEHGRTHGYIRVLASEYDWVDRVADYDAHLQEIVRIENEEKFKQIHKVTIATELNVCELLYNNIKSLKERQEGDNALSQSTLSSTLLNHEKSMAEHIENYYLLFGKPSKINPVDSNEHVNRRINKNSTDEELRKTLDTLLEEGSAEDTADNEQGTNRE